LERYNGVAALTQTSTTISKFFSRDEEGVAMEVMSLEIAERRQVP
jgi:hypothetical protein